MSQPSEITKDINDTATNIPKEDCPWYSGKLQPKSKYTYIILAVVVFVVLYYAYTKFYKNAEEFTEETASERTDPVSDFNLREAINELETMQKKILSKLSTSDNF
jgi:hypothetical protein